MRVCIYCKTEFFVSPSVRKKSCSPACRVAFSAKRKIKTCFGCGRLFKKHPDRGDKQIYCTLKCSANHLALLRRTVDEPPTGSGTRWLTLPHGKFALVDESDFELVSSFVWRADKKGYVSTKIDGRQMMLHSMLMGPSTRRTPIDHRNGDPLDNRRENLRIATGGVNRINSAINSNNTSGYKGVHRMGDSWCARIGYDGKRLHLGLFVTAEDAARAYDAAARKLFGDIARLNFV